MSEDNNNKGHFGGEVGYKNPPVTGQFKPGTSGNPKGRPKTYTTDIVNVFKDVCLIRKPVLINGETKFYSSYELFLMKVVQEMMKDGNHKDRRIFHDIVKHLKIEDRWMDMDFDAILNDPKYYDPEGELN